MKTYEAVEVQFHAFPTWPHADRCTLPSIHLIVALLSALLQPVSPSVRRGRFGPSPIQQAHFLEKLVKSYQAIRCHNPNITECAAFYLHSLIDAFHSTALTQLTLRRLMSYIYGAPILDVSRSHTTTQHSR